MVQIYKSAKANQYLCFRSFSKKFEPTLSRPRNDEDIVSALTFFTRNDAETVEVKLSMFEDEETNMLDQFKILRVLFPRINKHWKSLDYSVRHFVYQCFTNIRTDGFKVLHQQRQKDRSELPTAFVHGDEWGANFHLSKGGGLIPKRYCVMASSESVLIQILR